MSSANKNNLPPLPEESVSRREFLVRLGITGALIAGFRPRGPQALAAETFRSRF